jgi:hypothetical protein
LCLLLLNGKFGEVDMEYNILTHYCGGSKRTAFSNVEEMGYLSPRFRFWNETSGLYGPFHWPNLTGGSAPVGKRSGARLG